ncbi:MAG: adenylosuccinate synthetase [Prevotellaceae bacterium]|jgi:adenylosuccinate synthase|nr:adenylosuccinate synthetase [Prevotellaceae bacterium]
MPVSVVFGGQFGSEGKGKTTLFFARYSNAKAVIRVGGPNSGHTVISDNNEAIVLKQLPVSSIMKDVYSIITSGNYINVDILLKEIAATNISDKNLIIDPYAVIISENDLLSEKESGLKESIGSTGSGTGATLSRRINRDKNLQFAKDEVRLQKYIRNDTKAFLRNLLNNNERVIIEGTQGFGLSLLHSDLFPYSTSRDTSAAAFVSEAGLSPLDVDDVIMVLRSFPIRVGGNSGPLPLEIDWKYITENSGNASDIIEYTSVTKKIRRVAKFHPEIVKKSIEVNKPSRIVLNHVDYFDHNCNNGHITNSTHKEIKEIENLIGQKIDFIGMDQKSLYEF